ncbi:MAG: TetR family transcriptional regulator C-terminal domain-containing protein [Proteobacteria bacterium]|nr:TetR family transcriptional regulator C-terminal domain-containing protein [Pseudomonadota bacterium]
MSRSPRRSRPAPPPARPRATRERQRQRLIDACISALHVHGPSKTTVEKVVAIARMSPGIVRFYFDSKDAMLVASLEFLAAEFEERLLVPVAALRDRPVAALEHLVDLYLGVELASTRKVSVWYAFWGEASARQEYHDICGSRDSKFEDLVRELIASLVATSGARHLDADAIALGLIGVLEMLWQGFAFQTESTIDRDSARRRALAYLRSVFPGAFGAAAPAAIATLPASAYTSAALLAAERASLLRDAWQFAGLERELPAAGTWLALDSPAGLALVVRDASGRLRAFRNACPQRPHALLDGRAGRLAGEIGCPLHGLRYGLDGEPLGDTPGGALRALSVASVEGCVFVGPPASGPEVARPPAPVAALGASALTAGPATLTEFPVRANWKVLVELWLEPRAGVAPAGWSARRLAALTAAARDTPPAAFLGPNQLAEAGSGGLTVLQVLPADARGARLRVFQYPAASATRAERARAYLARRLERQRLLAEIALAESVQRGLESPGYAAEPVAAAPPALAAFRQAIARLLPGAQPEPGDPR